MELRQINQNLCETVRSFIEGEDDPSEDTVLGKLLQQVHIHIFAKCDAYEGTYEDLYTAFSRPLRDWVADSYTGEEEQRRRSEGFMSEFIASLGDKWRRESRYSRGYDAGMVKRVLVLLTDMSVYEWMILMYLLGPKEVVR